MTQRRQDLDSPIDEQPEHAWLEPLKPLANTNAVRVKVSWRWFTGTMLTGIAGLILIGGALYAAFDGRLHMASQATPALRGSFALGYGGPGLGKSDRMRRPANGSTIKYIIHESQTRRLGSKDFVEVKPYIRLSSQLSQAKSHLTSDLPTFNPLKLFAETSRRAAAANSAKTESADNIKVTYASLHVDDINFDIRRVKSVKEIQQQLKHMPDLDADSDIDAADGSGDGDLIGTAANSQLADGAVLLFANATDQFDTDSTGSIGGISNVSVVEKTDENELRAGFAEDNSQTASMSIKVAPGDNLIKLLIGAGADYGTAKTVVQAMAPRFAPKQLKAGQELRVSLFSQNGADTSKDVQLAKVSIFEEKEHRVSVQLTESGSFTLASASEALSPAVKFVPDPVPTRKKRARLYDSLFETGRLHGIDDRLIEQVIRIHSYDADLRRLVQPGDDLELFFAEEDDADAVPEVLFSSLTLNGETRRYYRFRTSDDGRVDYYDETGRSAKKFLIRKPLNGGRLRSHYGMRRHPILRYTKMHTGVDWSARRGTPIVAAGNGIVEKAGWMRGYGRYIRLRHANGYKTAYAHLSRIAQNVKPGARVRQGQLIGNVGSTGLSTGPHLHYEVIVNGRFVDPMRIRVPRGRSLRGAMLAAFKREKARISRLMNQSPASSRVAQYVDPAGNRTGQ